MEYLLGGKASDKDNLEYVIGRIRILRFAVNYGYLLTDKDMQMEVDTLATTLSAVFLSPEIGPVIKHALLLAWAYGESLTDVKTLLAGKKVPAVKSKESWNLTLDGLLELAKNRSIPEGKETEEGNSYEQYLQMMLVLKSKEELSMRALDLVEMNLRSNKAILPASDTPSQLLYFLLALPYKCPQIADQKKRIKRHSCRPFPFSAPKACSCCHRSHKKCKHQHSKQIPDP